MSAMMNLAKQRAAMVVGDFDFRNNGAPLTALPAILTALNATYTRNSVKNVVQSGALVALTANQFGTSYDPAASEYGYVPEPAATNLCTNSDGAASTYTCSNTADGTAVPGFTNGIAFGDNSVQRSATKAISVTSGTVYSISFFVLMGDGNAPVVGTTNSTGDFSIALNAVIATTKLERLIGSNIYRVSASITASATASHAAGCIKYTGQSARTFHITGIQVETGLRATSYIATTGSTASRSADVLTVPLWINNAKDSQDGSTGNWVRGNSSVTTSGTAPDGTATAQLVTATVSGVVTLYATGIKAPAATVTYSVYVKQGNKATCPLLLRNATTATNFTQGTLTFATGAITGAGWTVTNEGNGWFRCKFTQSTGITVGDTLSAFIGFAGFGTDVLSDTVYFWGAQIQPGSVATAYRRTVGNLEFSKNRAWYSANCTGPTWQFFNVSGSATQSGNAFTFGASSTDRVNAQSIIVGTGSYTYSAKLSGSGSIRLSAYDGDTSYKNALVITLTSTPTWYTLTVTLTAGGNSGVLGINNNGAGTAGASFTVHGVQVENGSSLTDYEPTNTIAPSANANITGFSSAAYSLFADYREDINTAAIRTMLSVDDTTTSNRAVVRADAGNTIATIMVSGGTTATNTTESSIPTTRSKCGFAAKTDGFLRAINGTAGTSDVSGNMALSPLFLRIGNDLSSSGQWNGFLYKEGLITLSLTQAQLNGLTT